MSRYEMFDRSRLRLGPLCERGSDISAKQVTRLAAPESPLESDSLQGVVQAMLKARETDRPVIVMIGGHPIKLGLSRFLIDLMERDLITHLATNGAGLIHDFELGLHGGTSEDVAKWIKVGQFGLWQETGGLNDIGAEAARRDEGFGEGLGRVIESNEYPHRDISIAAAGWRCRVPVTCHVSIGSDIFHGYPNCDGAALGEASHTDFLIFARAIEKLEGGVFLNIGSAVTGPEVYLKALSMGRNVARQSDVEICRFTTAVFDIVDLPENWQEGPGPRPQGEDAASSGKTHPLYYYRPWKTILIRTIADGGNGRPSRNVRATARMAECGQEGNRSRTSSAAYYVKGDHRDTIPSLWHYLVDREQTEPGSIAEQT